MTQKIVLITGASSGIGRSTAKKFLEKDYKNKKLVEKKFSEWENVLEEDQDVQSQRLWRHFQ